MLNNVISHGSNFSLFVSDCTNFSLFTLNFSLLATYLANFSLLARISHFLSLYQWNSHFSREFLTFPAGPTLTPAVQRPRRPALLVLPAGSSHASPPNNNNDMDNTMFLTGWHTLADHCWICPRRAKSEKFRVSRRMMKVRNSEYRAGLVRNLS